MLCKAGKITKRDIGAIIINQNNTSVELKPASVDSFLEAIGADLRIEKSVTVKRLDKAPTPSSDRGHDDYPKKKRRKDRKPFDRKKPGGKPKYAGESDEHTGSYSSQDRKGSEGQGEFSDNKKKSRKARKTERSGVGNFDQSRSSGPPKTKKRHKPRKKPNDS